MDDNCKHSEITENIIKAFYVVYNKLGYGFLEKVYENAMMIELQKLRMVAEKQKPIKVKYEGQSIGEYFADIVVEDKAIVELKAAENLCEEHENQLVNYLKATNIEVGLLFNFEKFQSLKEKCFLLNLNHYKS